MPIQADYCDAWFTACRHDLFCAEDDGNFFSCAREYEVSDVLILTFYKSDTAPLVVI